MTNDAEILRVLRSRPGGVSGAELSQHLGVSRATVSARVDELRTLGYEIEASPHSGYRLTGAPDLLHADDLMSRLEPRRVVGRDIQIFRETTSTNDIVEKLARDGVKEGVAVFAEAQTRGRGRLGRRWISPARKGLWFSILLRPRLRPQAVTQITIAAATALARSVESHTGLAVSIKWPNDLLLRGKKVAGILTEMSGELDQVKYVILGIGVDVNVDQFPAELRQIATSLRIETEELVDRAALAAEILRQLDRQYARVCAGQFETIANEWEERCTTIGRDVIIVAGQRRVQGRAEALDQDGALLVRTQHGRLQAVIGGDVTVQK